VLCVAVGCKAQKPATKDGLWDTSKMNVLKNNESTWKLLGLERLWGVAGEGSAPRNVWIVKDYLIIEAANSLLGFFNRQSGVYLFALDIGSPVVGHPVPWEVSERAGEAHDLLYIVATGTLFEIRMDSQSVERQLDLKFAAATAPTMDFQNLYFGSDNNRLCVVNRRLWYYSAGRRVGAPIHSTPVMGDNAVLFGCQDGNVYGVTRESMDITRTFQTNGPVSADLVLENHVIYAVSHDYNVYALTEVQPSSKAANFLWKVSLESVIADSPVSIGERLYVNTVSKGLFAMEKADGSILWNVPQGQRVLAVGKKNVYVLMRGHRPSIGLVDFETGELKELIDARGYELFTTNTAEPTLYMVDRGGGVLALREWDAEVAAGRDEAPDEFEESGEDEQD